MHEKFDGSFDSGSGVLQLPVEVPEVVIPESYAEQSNTDDQAQLDTSVVGVSELRTDSGVVDYQEVDQPVAVQEEVGESREAEQETPTPALLVEAAGTVAVSGHDKVESNGDEPTGSSIIEEKSPEISSEGEKPELPKEDTNDSADVPESEPEVESSHDDGVEEEPEAPRSFSDGGDVVDPPNDNKGAEVADSGDDNPDESPSLDPRDPRGGDSLTEVMDAVFGALREKEGSESNQDRFIRLIASALGRSEEAKELDLVMGGKTSEEAAAIVGGSLDKRLDAAEERLEELKGQVAENDRNKSDTPPKNEEDEQ